MANVKNFQLLDDFHFHVAATEIECFFCCKELAREYLNTETEHNGSRKLRAAADDIYETFEIAGYKVRTAW